MIESFFIGIAWLIMNIKHILFILKLRTWDSAINCIMVGLLPIMAYMIFSALDWHLSYYVDLVLFILMGILFLRGVFLFLKVILAKSIYKRVLKKHLVFEFKDVSEYGCKFEGFTDGAMCFSMTNFSFSIHNNSSRSVGFLYAIFRPKQNMQSGFVAYDEAERHFHISKNLKNLYVNDSKVPAEMVKPYEKLDIRANIKYFYPASQQNIPEKIDVTFEIAIAFVFLCVIRVPLTYNFNLKVIR